MGDRDGSGRVVVIGAGIGGLAASLLLAAGGHEVELVERAANAGGKIRTLAPGARAIDAGPTVLTLRPVFEALFAASGARLDDHLTLEPCRVLARHWWEDGAALDLHADQAGTADAIGRLAGAAEARGYLAFARRAADTWRTLEDSFVRAARPGVATLVARAGVPALMRIGAFATLAGALDGLFDDPRLRQLFGRYATYCGTSPYRAPATLMLIAHVESLGVWRVGGGMAALAGALAARAAASGVRLRLGAEVCEVLVRGGRATGVRLDSGEEIAAAGVVAAVDTSALAAGLLGPAARRAVGRQAARRRSLSAVTWAIEAETAGVPLGRHNLLFSRDDAAEFRALDAGSLAPDPTIYLCAQDRAEPDDVPPGGPERLLCLVNAPAAPIDQEELARCETRVFRKLQAHGLRLQPLAPPIRTAPADWARLYPGTAGALYGPPTEGPWGSFRRPGAQTRLPGLYLAGGSVHPGPGIPMAALSGQRAAWALMADRASTRRSRGAAISGGTSMRSATTDAPA